MLFDLDPGVLDHLAPARFLGAEVTVEASGGMPP